LKRMTWLALASVILLAGCTQTAVREDTSAVPVSEQPAVGEAQKRAKVHTDLGLAYYDSKGMAIALEEARKAIAADAGYSPAYNLLALVHMYLMENGLAEQAFRKALSIAPNDPETNNNYGWFLCTSGREKEGIERLMSAVKNPLYATPTKPFTNAGLCSLRLKDETAAAEYFKRAAAADERNAQALYHLASLSFQRGDFLEAQRLISAVHDVQEPNAESLWLALRIERKLGDQAAESKFANQLRKGFAGSKEQQMLIRGQFE
jgi:type IV pilus assembly protein PilF